MSSGCLALAAGVWACASDNLPRPTVEPIASPLATRKAAPIVASRRSPRFIPVLSFVRDSRGARISVRWLFFVIQVDIFSSRPELVPRLFLEHEGSGHSEAGSAPHLSEGVEEAGKDVDEVLELAV